MAWLSSSLSWHVLLKFQICECCYRKNRRADLIYRCIMLYMLVPLSLFIYFQYDVFEPVIFYWLIYSKSQAILKIYIFIKVVEPHQGRSLWTHLLGSKPRINDPTSQNRALGNTAKLLVGIELRHLLLIPCLDPLGCILMDQPRHATSSYMTNSWFEGSPWNRL